MNTIKARKKKNNQINKYSKNKTKNTNSNIKHLCSIFLFLFIFSITIFNYKIISLGTDLTTVSNDEEQMSTEEILNAVIETSANISNDIGSINSKTYVVLDRTTNTILFGKNELEQTAMASTTKIMTCIVILENCNLDDIVTISSNAASTTGSLLGLHTNDTISVKDLLYGLMLKSGNDAAVALSEHCSRKC